jgi:CRP-like cAMP-binding protein
LHFVYTIKEEIMPEQSYNEYRLPAGSYLFREGDPPDNLYHILEGRVEILRHSAAGVMIISEVVESGGVIGDLELVLGRSRDFSIRAQSDVRVEVIPAGVFGELFTTQLGIQLRPILQSLAERLRVALSNTEGVEDGGEPLRFPEPQPAKPPVDLPIEKPADTTFTVEFTPRTAQALKGLSGVEPFSTSRFPLHIGRYTQKRTEDMFRSNHLFLREKAPHSVSRTHCSLVQTESGIEFQDRGSTLGSIINGVLVGGKSDAPASATLREGVNSIVLGGSASKMAFEVRVNRK